MDICYEILQSPDVMVSGERKSFINLAPLDSEVFKYIWIPLKSGLISLPSVRIGKDEGFHFIKKSR